MAPQAEVLKAEMDLAPIPGTSLEPSRIAIGTWALGADRALFHVHIKARQREEQQSRASAHSPPPAYFKKSMGWSGTVIISPVRKWALSPTRHLDDVS
jgi:hypothetical protein